MLRFSPAPTGDITLESLWVALLNYLVAKQKNEPFLVRVNDSDKDAVIEGKDSEMMQVLEKFAIIHDQVYHHSEHQHMQQSLAIRLLQEKKAFICTCMKEDGTPASSCQADCTKKESRDCEALKQEKTPFVVRLHAPQDAIIYDDIIQGTQETPAQSIGAPMLLKPDATPTPDFATACEDMFGDINFIIQDNHAKKRTPTQHYIKTVLGYLQPTTYAHLPPLHDATGQEVLLETLLKKGFIPDAIIQYLLGMGHDKAPEGVYYFADALAWFDIAAITPAPLTFDEQKLRALNRAHLMQMDDKRLSALFGFADADIGKLAKLYLEEGAATTTELQEKVKAIFGEKAFIPPYDDAMLSIQRLLMDAPFFDTYEALVEHIVAHTPLIKENVEIPLRRLLTDQNEGPDLSKIYTYIKFYLLEVIS